MESVAKITEPCEGKDCPIKNHCKLGLTAFLVSYFIVSHTYDVTRDAEGLDRGCSEFVEIEKR
jgi:hypothetical protein